MHSQILENVENQDKLESLENVGTSEHLESWKHK